MLSGRGVGFATRVCLGCCLSLLVPSPARPWSPKGHRIIASIAQQHLSPKPQTRLRLLFGKDASLIELAGWADEVRADRPETSPWHYINISPGATDLDLKRDCPNGDCITTRIRRFVGIVRLGLKKQVERQEAFKFLVHLLGDLHQPLHAGYPQDRGGNEVPVVVRGEESSLHAYWDSGVLDQTGESEAALAERLMRAITPLQKSEWRRGRLRDWTWESHLLAVRVAYGALPSGNPKQLNDDYIRQTAAIAEEQLAKAGIRLAEVINNIWSY